MGRGRSRANAIKREDDPTYVDTATETVEDMKAVFMQRGMDAEQAEARARDALMRIEKSKHTGVRNDRGQSPTESTARESGAAHKAGAVTKQGKPSKTAGVHGAAKKGSAVRKTTQRTTSPVRAAERDKKETFGQRETEYSPAEPHRGRRLSKR